MKSRPGDYTDVTTKDIKIVNTGKSEIVLDSKTVFPCDPVTKDYVIIGRLKPEKRTERRNRFRSKSSTRMWGRTRTMVPHVNVCKYPPSKQGKIEEERKKATNLHEFDTISKKQIYEKNKFMFSIETCCGMSSRDIFTCGIETLQSRFRDLGESLLNRTSSKIKILNDKPCGSIVLKLLGETDTAGFIIQQWLFDKVQFIGYFSPHPMEKSIVFTILPKESGASTPDKRRDEVFEILHETCVEISKYLDNMINEWTSFSRK